MIFLGLFLTLFSCATTHEKQSPSNLTISIKESTSDDIKRVSADSAINPFLEPATLLRGKLNEFYTVIIDIETPEPIELDVIATMVSGKDVYIPAYLKEDFLQFWAIYDSHDSPSETLSVTKRNNLIQKYCLPGELMQLKKGNYIFYLPFVGPNPIPKPAEIYVQISGRDGIYAEFINEVED
jgi:hypothetical protein